MQLKKQQTLVFNQFFLKTRNMKQKIWFLLLLFVLGNGWAAAQRQKTSEDYMNSSFSSVPFNMWGKMTYNYILDDYGNHLKDGPLSINCKINQTYGSGYQSIKVVGQNTMNATFKQGLLNGALKSNYNVALTDSRGKTESHSASITGSFLNGVPNGNFVVKRNLDYKGSLNATYKNGVLVGTFSCLTLDDRSYVQKYSGTLTQGGKFTGSWNLNGKKAVFQNGVLLSMTYDEHSTKPALTEISKKYAAGTITKEELQNMGYYVCVENVPLGKFAFNAIYSDSGVEFEKIGGYDFSNGLNVQYEYLKELSFLTNEGVELLLDHVFCGIKGISTNYPAVFRTNYINFDYNDDSEYYKEYDWKDHYLKYDEGYGVYSVQANKYYTNIMTCKPDGYDMTVYLKPEFVDVIDRQVDTLLCVTSKSLKDVACEKLGSLEWGADRSSSKLIKAEKSLKGFYEKFKIESREHTERPDFLVWCYKNTGYPSYIIKSSVADYELMLEKLSSDIQVAQEKEKQEIIARQKAEAEALLAERKAALTPAFEFIIANKKASKMTYDVDFEKYFVCKEQTDYWRLDASAVLKPFCPLIGYEILDVTDSTVKCRLVKKGKKKTTPTYEIELRYRNEYGKLKLELESFDMNNAKLIE